jgi:hypothetical protein
MGKRAPLGSRCLPAFPAGRKARTAYHAISAVMKSLKKTGTDFTSAQGIDPKRLFSIMHGFDKVVDLDAKAGGSPLQEI